jgi:protein TonB
MPVSRPVPASLEVRLPHETAAAPVPEVAATAAPEASAQEDRAEKDVPVERSGLVSAGHYFDSAEVDVKAEPVELAPLIYPEAAYIRRLPGVVTIRAYISESGAIDAVDIVSAEPPDMFETAALDALLKTRFKPAELFGRPVASVKLVSINFDPQQDQPSNQPGR